jgi:hypothetical protein
LTQIYWKVACACAVDAAARAAITATARISAQKKCRKVGGKKRRKGE